jgi:hypothetical protein
MPALTRRRYPEAREECWHIYFDDVHVGTIAIRAGIPHDEDPWGWSCGFYPGSEPGEYLYGTAIDFDQARRDFEAGASFQRSAPMAIIRPGAISATGRRENMPCGSAAKSCLRLLAH